VVGGRGAWNPLVGKVGSVFPVPLLAYAVRVIERRLGFWGAALLSVAFLGLSGRSAAVL